MRTVSDTSPISNLAIIGQLSLLQEQFEKVLIPPVVLAECEKMGNEPARNFVFQAIKGGWLVLTPLANNQLADSLRSSLDPGESQAIALAIEQRADLLLIDEREGRRIARESGLKVRGILGVLLRAKKTGRLEQIRPCIYALKQRAHFFIAPDLEKSVLADAGEQ